MSEVSGLSKQTSISTVKEEVVGTGMRINLIFTQFSLVVQKVDWINLEWPRNKKKQENPRDSVSKLLQRTNTLSQNIFGGLGQDLFNVATVAKD